MTQKDKELLFELLKKAEESGILNIYDSNENHYEVDWLFMDIKINIKINVS